jgi:hypothetical protein
MVGFATQRPESSCREDTGKGAGEAAERGIRKWPADTSADTIAGPWSAWAGAEKLGPMIGGAAAEAKPGVLTEPAAPRDQEAGQDP